MTPPRMKTFPALLCGIFLFLILETKSEVSSENINHTTAAEQPNTGHHLVTPEVIANTSLHNIPLPTAVDKTKVTTATTNDHPHNSTDKTPTTRDERSSHSGSISGTENPSHTDTASTNPLTAKVPSPTEVKSTEQKSTFTPASETQVLTTGLPQTSSNKDTTPAATVTKTPENSTAFTAAPKTTESSPAANISTNTVTTLPTNSTRLKTTASATQTTLSGKANITNGEFDQYTSPSVNATNGSALVIHTETTQNPKTINATTALPLTSKSTSITTTSFSNKSTTERTVFTTAHNTTNATEGILRPVNPKILSTSTPKSTTVSESPQSTDAQPCSSIGVVKQCLIIIASLAVVATIFIICTIVLCTKLSSKKYRVRKNRQDTEMMCISSLMPERSNPRRHNYTRQRSPVPNGVLVIHSCADSDDDIGDNLTLSSFLPENDRCV